MRRHDRATVRLTSHKPRWMQWAICSLFLLSADTAFSSERLFESVPDDAVAAILIERPRQDFPAKLIKPILGVAMPSRALATSVVNAVEHLPVPTLIGMYAPTRDGHRLDFFALVDLRNRAFDVDHFVEKYLVPVLEAGSKRSGRPFDRVDIDKTGEARRVTLKPAKKALFAYAVKDKRAFLSTRLPDVQHWCGGNWPERTWTGRSDVKRLLARLSDAAAISVVVNPEPLIRLIPRPEPNSNEDLVLRILAPTDVKAVAGELAWDQRGIRLKGLASLADPCRGMLGSIVGTSGCSTTLGILPDDFFAVGRIGFNSGASIVDGIYQITDTFDPAIAEEYRTEIAEFKNETGVNFTTEVLGGLSGEAVFGARVDFMKRPPIAWTVVCPLGEPERFADSVAKLEKYYGLKAATVPIGELPVRFVQDGGPIAWAIHDKRLIVAESPQTVGEIAKVDPKSVSGEPKRDNLRDCRKALGGGEQFCLLVDIEQFFEKAPIGAMMLGASGTKLLRGSNVGLSFSTRQHVAELNVCWSRNRKSADADVVSPDEPAEGDTFEMEALVSTLVEATGRGRDAAERTLVMANMRAVGQGLHLWAAEHKNQFPDDLSELVNDGLVTLAMFAKPGDESGPLRVEDIATLGNVIYRPGLSSTADPREILLAEKIDANAAGANFLFVDGHVEYVPEPEAGELIEKIKAGAAEVRR